MKTALLIDLETTGLDPTEHQVNQYGAILWSLEFKDIIAQYEQLFSVKENPAKNINRIDPGLSSRYGWDYVDVFDDLQSKADVCIAYSDFDKQWFTDDSPEHLPEMHLPWCNAMHIDWPQAHKPNMSLVTLALAHNIPVFNAHRALDDCRLLAELLGKLDDPAAAITKAMRPRDVFIANVNYDNRQLAKDNGFVWNTIIQKQWAQYLVAEDVAAMELPFTVSRGVI